MPFIIIFPMFFNINGIFFAQPVSDILATILSLLLVIAGTKKNALFTGSAGIASVYSDSFSFLIPWETSQVVSSMIRSNGRFRSSAIHWE